MTVHILTTNGPATIQRIREEDSHVASVICLDGRAEALPVSPAYDAFVRKPVGIVEKLTGHDAYRMDVSARVDDGRSWQLAAYIAHVAMLKVGGAGLHVFATGEVDDSLSIRAVGHIAEKLQALSIYLEAHNIPRDQALILIPSSIDNAPTQQDGIPIHQVSNVTDALKVIGLDGAKKVQSKTKPDKPAPSDPSRLRWMKWIALLGAVGILFWFGTDFARWEAISKQGRAFELEETINQPSNSINALRANVFRKWLSFGKADADSLKFDGALSIAGNVNECQITELVTRRPLIKAVTKDEAVCGIEISAYVNDPSLKVVGRMAYWPNGLGATERAARIMRGHEEATGRVWVLPFKDVPKSGAVVRLVTITGRSSVQGSQPWFQDLLRSDIQSPAFIAARQRIETLGYRVAIKDWHLE